MIVKMKKITLLCVESERVSALEKLRELGIMHVDHETKVDTESVTVSARDLAEIANVVNILSGFKAKPATGSGSSGKEIFEQADNLIRNRETLGKRIEELSQDIETLQPWGDFDPGMVTKLAAGGIHVLFCRTYRNNFKTLELPEQTVVEIIGKTGKEVCFLLISREPLDASLYPVVSLPQERLSVLRDQLETAQKEKQQCDKQLEALAASANAVKEYFSEKSVEHEFLTNREGMVSDGTIAYLSGYIPADELPTLTEAAHKNGWALTADDPAPDDARVPTLIRNPRWVKLIDPLFDFIGITPGYREKDVSVFFLIAFPIFFGILIGDCAYGVLFISVALLFKFLLRKNPKAQVPLNLLILLSVFSVIMGLLNGSCLGLPRKILPGFLQGLDFLADPASSPTAVALGKRLNINPEDLTNKFTQWFCFLLAALHLTSAHLLKYSVSLRDWRSLGNLGWTCVIWGNFFTAVNLIVFPGTFPKYVGFALYGIGLLLIVATVAPSAALNLPFDLVSSFVDVLSYIRLFAVGLSSVYVATCFNNMGKMVLNALPKEMFVIGLIGLILVALAGHVLNILLGFMGVLVHAVRLNTLEFSNHAGMEWTGFAYRPFANRNTENQTEK